MSDLPPQDHAVDPLDPDSVHHVLTDNGHDGATPAPIIESLLRAAMNAQPDEHHSLVIDQDHHHHLHDHPELQPQDPQDLGHLPSQTSVEVGDHYDIQHHQVDHQYTNQPLDLTHHDVLNPDSHSIVHPGSIHDPMLASTSTLADTYMPEETGMMEDQTGMTDINNMDTATVGAAYEQSQDPFPGLQMLQEAGVMEDHHLQHEQHHHDLDLDHHHHHQHEDEGQHHVEETTMFEQQAMEVVDQVDRVNEAEAVSAVVETSGEQAGYDGGVVEEQPPLPPTIQEEHALPLDTADVEMVDPTPVVTGTADPVPSTQAERGTNRAQTVEEGSKPMEPVNTLPEALQGKSQEEIDDVKRRIVDRLESLLSATALPHDKLLFSLSLRNTSGWIPLSTLAKYPKVRSYADTYGLSFVAEAVRDANDSREAGADEIPVEAGEPGVEDPKRGKKVGPPFLGRGKEAELVVDNKGERIRRKEIILKADTAWDRTVYAEGFGILDPSTTTTQDAIEEWFEQFAPITVVRFRRARDPFGSKGRGDFRGSVFCEFRTVEGADLFLRTNPKPLFNGTEIVAMFKETYLESRIQIKALRHSNVIPIEQVDQEVLQNVDKSLLKHGNKKRKRGEEEDEVVANQKRTAVIYILFNKHRVGVNRKTGTVINKEELVYPERALLKFTGAGETGDWKVLKEDLVNAEIEHSFLYLPRRSSIGYFAAPEAIGDEVLERLRNLHLIVGDSEIEWERVEGQEERDFYAKRASFAGKLAVKMADEKEALELDAVKETAKEIRASTKERSRAKSATVGTSRKKRSRSSSKRKGKTEDDPGSMQEEDGPGETDS